jgi:hypothetical protein
LTFNRLHGAISQKKKKKKKKKKEDPWTHRIQLGAGVKTAGNELSGSF